MTLDSQLVLVMAPYDGLGIGPDGMLYAGANEFSFSCGRDAGGSFDPGRRPATSRIGPSCSSHILAVETRMGKGHWNR